MIIQTSVTYISLALLIMVQSYRSSYSFQSSCFIGDSKTVPWFSLMHKERNELCIIYQLIYGSVL